MLKCVRRKKLYPLYKTEVYKRREQMMRISVFGCGFLLMLLFFLLGEPPKSWSITENILAISGLGIFSCFLGYLIQQQYRRHKMAKQSLIEIERTLGLYEEGLYHEHGPLYPKTWETQWLFDRSIYIYIGSIVTLTFFIVAVILFRHI